MNGDLSLVNLHLLLYDGDLFDGELYASELNDVASLNVIVYLLPFVL
jgi:hypothetical protein